MERASLARGSDLLQSVVTDQHRAHTYRDAWQRYGDIGIY